MQKITYILQSIHDSILSCINTTNELFFEQLVAWRKRMLDYSMYGKSTRLIPTVGEIYDVDLGVGIGSELQKTRPCIVISQNGFNKGDTISIIPMTSYKGHKKIGIISLMITKTEMNGLENDSVIMLAKMREVSKLRMRSKRGVISGSDYIRIQKGLIQYLGLQKNHSQGVVSENDSIK